MRIFNMCHPLSEEGVSVTLYTRDMTAKSVAECLRFYGLSPTANLKIVPLLDSRCSPTVLQKRIASSLAGVPRTEWHYVFTRDESGLGMVEHLREVDRHQRMRFVFEAHRLCFLHAIEKGRRKHGVAHSSSVDRVKVLERKAVGDADALVCVTPGVLDALREYFQPTCPALILPNGTSLPENLPDDEVRDIEILYIGKLQRRKGIHDLVKAMTFLPGRQLYVVGGNARQIAEIAQLATNCGVADQVKLTGFIPPRDSRSLLRRARVGVCPLPTGVSVIADRFTCPLKILEMMGAGVPIVATDLPTVRALLQHGSTALLVEPNNPEALAAAIAKLLEDRRLALQLSREARFTVSEQTWARRASVLKAFLESL